MPKFVLLFHMPKDLVVPAEDRESIFHDMVKWEADLEVSGKGCGTMPLYPANEAVNIVLRGVEAKSEAGVVPGASEVLVGSSTIEVSNMSEATGIAEQCPHLRCGRIEVRQIRE